MPDYLAPLNYLSPNGYAQNNMLLSASRQSHCDFFETLTLCLKRPRVNSRVRSLWVVAQFLWMRIGTPFLGVLCLNEI